MKKEIEKRNKNLKKLGVCMIVLDILALAMLIFEIITKDISYQSYVVLIFSNLIVFITIYKNLKAN